VALGDGLQLAPLVRRDLPAGRNSQIEGNPFCPAALAPVAFAAAFRALVMVAPSDPVKTLSQSVPETKSQIEKPPERFTSRWPNFWGFSEHPFSAARRNTHGRRVKT